MFYTLVLNCCVCFVWLTLWHCAVVYFYYYYYCHFNFIHFVLKHSRIFYWDPNRHGGNDVVMLTKTFCCCHFKSAAVVVVRGCDVTSFYWFHPSRMKLINHQRATLLLTSFTKWNIYLFYNGLTHVLWTSSFKDVPDKYFLAITSGSCDHTLSKTMFCSKSPSGGSPLLGQVPHLHVCICSLLLWREHCCVYCVPYVDSSLCVCVCVRARPHLFIPSPFTQRLVSCALVFMLILMFWLETEPLIKSLI